MNLEELIKQAQQGEEKPQQPHSEQVVNDTINLSEDGDKENIDDRTNKKPRKKLGRTVQIMTRFTPEEEKRIRANIEKSGRRQGDFLRDMILTGVVYEVPLEVSKADAVKETKKLSREMGKATGMLKQTITALKEANFLDQEATEQLILNASSAIKMLNSYNKELRKEIRKWQY